MMRSGQPSLNLCASILRHKGSILCYHNLMPEYTYILGLLGTDGIEKIISERICQTTGYTRNAHNRRKLV